MRQPPSSGLPWEAHYAGVLLIVVSSILGIALAVAILLSDASNRTAAPACPFLGRPSMEAAVIFVVLILIVAWFVHSMSTSTNP